MRRAWNPGLLKQESRLGTGVCHSSIQFSFKIKNWKFMSIFDCHIFITKTTVPYRKYFTFSLSVEYCDRTYNFTLILSTVKRKMKLSGFFVSSTMLQAVAFLCSFCFRRKLKNRKLKIAINFQFFVFLKILFWLLMYVHITLLICFRLSEVFLLLFMSIFCYFVVNYHSFFSFPFYITSCPVSQSISSGTNFGGKQV